MGDQNYSRIGYRKRKVVHGGGGSSEHHHHHGRRYEIVRALRILGMAAVLIQALLSGIFLYSINATGMLPWKYLFLIIVVLIGLLALGFVLQYRHFRARTVGLVLSSLMCALLLVAVVYLNQVVNTIVRVQGSYKTDQMVVAVRSDDKAGELKDAANYTFGIVTAVDGEKSEKMQEDITSALDSDISVRDYATPVEEARALLNGEIDAAIYNEAYSGLIGDVIQDYSNKVRVIYHYGIRTALVQESVEPGEPFNLLISGIDVSGDISQNSRSDVNIIMTVNPRTKQILLTSTPRDYYVQIPGVSGEARDKLTHAGIYGIDASMQTLEQLYGIDLTYYARVNFTTLVSLVDTLGGITVYSPATFVAYTDHDVTIKKGINHLNGREALAFCRERYSFEDGDNQRGRDQEAVLTEILNKLMSPAVLANWSDILDSLGGSFQTNMSEKKIAELVNQQLSEGGSWSIQKQAAAQGGSELTTTYSGGSQKLYVMIPDMYSVHEAAARISMVLSAQGSSSK